MDRKRTATGLGVLERLPDGVESEH
jgi:hypothetical protein